MKGWKKVLYGIFYKRLPIICFLLVLGFVRPGQAELSQEWGGENWNKRLTEPYQEWKPIREALTELAGRAGVNELNFSAGRNDTFMVPLSKGMTLKEAFQNAASLHALEGLWENGRLTVRETKKAGNWQSIIGGTSVPIMLGEVKGSLLRPAGKKLNKQAPWVWYAPNSMGPYHAWLCKQLLDEGISIVSVGVGESQGNPKGREIFTAFYEKLRAEYGLAKKAVLFPQSRGGLMLYNWAAEHPKCVAAIGGIYPVCDIRSYPKMEIAAKAYGLKIEELEAQLLLHNPVDRLEPLAKAGIPIFHVHGDKDGTVPLEKNSAELARRYRALKGEITVLVVPGKGHENPANGREFFQCKELAAFLIKQAKAAVESKEE